jgi:hypothetical protein
MGEPDDIAWAVVWLASDEAKFVTGAEIAIDGGYTRRADADDRSACPPRRRLPCRPEAPARRPDRAEAARRLAEHGPNRLPEVRRAGRCCGFWRSSTTC